MKLHHFFPPRILRQVDTRRREAAMSAMAREFIEAETLHVPAPTPYDVIRHTRATTPPRT